MSLVTLRGGVSVSSETLQVLIDVEFRGGTFTVEGDAVRVMPVGLLTPEERAVLVAHKPEVLRILAYEPPNPTVEWEWP